MRIAFLFFLANFITGLATSCVRKGLFKGYLVEFEKTWLEIVKHYKTSVNRMCLAIERNMTIETEYFDNIESEIFEYLNEDN